MNQKLFSNIKKMTTIFSIAILSLTVAILLLKVTVFRNVEGNPVSVVKSEKKADDEQTYAFEYEISDRIVFSTAESPSNPRIKNSESNTALMQVNIIRNDNKRSIYISGYIHPGISQSTIKLQHTNLEKGVYECTAEITAFDPETFEPIETYSQPIVIEIQNGN